MTTPAVTVNANTSADAAARLIEERNISALPVVDDDGILVGVVSTTDLVRDLALANGGSARTVARLMSAPAIVARADEGLDEAAWRLVAARVHRLVVVDGTRPIGVLSVRDVLAEVKRRRVNTPIGAIMTSPVVTIELGASIEEATARLTSAAVHGLVVVDGTMPVGVFTHTEALAARHFGRALRQDPVEEIMSYETICLDVATAVHRAAGYAAALNVRRILVTEHKHVVGILSLVDLVAVLARAPEDATSAA